MTKKNILFVCHGNVFRSAIAERLCRNILRTKKLDQLVQVNSRGIQGSAGTPPPEHLNLKAYPSLWEKTLPTLNEFNLDLHDHIATPIIHPDVELADIIVALDRRVFADEPISALLKQFPEYRNKMRLFSELSNHMVNIIDPLEHPGTTPREIILKINQSLEENIDTLLRWTHM